MRAALLLIALVGCRFDGAGATDPSVPDAAAPDATDEADAPLRDAEVDGPIGPDCSPITAGVDGRLEVPNLPAPTIDGNLADWTSCYLPLDEMTAGLVRKVDETATIPRGRFSVMHDGENLYLAAIVEGVLPLGNAMNNDIFRNDGVVLYVDADGQMQAPGYDADASQIIVDHAGRRHAYRQVASIGEPSISASVMTNGATYTVEIMVTPSTYGVTAFAETIGFDVGIDGGTGPAQENEILWHQRCNMDTGCQCPNGDDAPYCNAQQFGDAHLVP